MVCYMKYLWLNPSFCQAAHSGLSSCLSATEQSERKNSSDCFCEVFFFFKFWCFFPTNSKYCLVNSRGRQSICFWSFFGLFIYIFEIIFSHVESFWKNLWAEKNSIPLENHLFLFMCSSCLLSFKGPVTYHVNISLFIYASHHLFEFQHGLSLSYCLN